MNDARRHDAKQSDPEGDEPDQGPNLVLLYSLIALAMAVAIALAAWIVLPFYRQR
jgi:hypothetical protein